MKKTISLCISIILSLFALIPSLYAQDTDRPWVYKDMTNQIEMHDKTSDIRSGDMILYSKISAISTTQSSYDVYAPFDGRVEELHAELFDTVDTDSILATVFTTELAAMMDSTPESSKSQTRRRWQDTFRPFYIKPEEKGIITKIHVTPNTKVYAGDRLFTISRKVLLIGKNIEPIYNPLLEGMTAEVEHYRTGNLFMAKLTRYIPIKDKPYYYRLWLEVLDIKKGMAIGEQYDGDLTVAKSIGTRMIDRKNIIRHNGKKYLLMEVETGLETENEIEVIRPLTKVLDWNYIKEGKPLPVEKKENFAQKAAKANATAAKKADSAASPSADDDMPRVVVDSSATPKPKAAAKTNAAKKNQPRNAPAKKKPVKGKAVKPLKLVPVKPAVRTPAPDSPQNIPLGGAPADEPETGNADTLAPAAANPDDAKPLDAKVEGESDTKVFTSNDDVSNDFLEGED